MSEAAKPADPERALAPDREAALLKLESLLADAEHEKDARVQWDKTYQLANAAQREFSWLLPLARAGLRCEMDACVAADAVMARNRVEALEQEYAKCVRALASIEFGMDADEMAVCYACVEDGGGHREHTPDCLIGMALSGPLAAAVLRSPEPATESPADGGA